MLALKTTSASDGLSPAAKLFGRNVRTNLPSAQGKERKFERKELVNLSKERKYPIQTGTTVRINTDKQNDWSDKGVVLEKLSQPRSYVVRNSKGNILRRNRKHLLPTEERYDVKLGDELDYSWYSSSETCPEQEPYFPIVLTDIPAEPSSENQAESDALLERKSVAKEGNQNSPEVKRTRSGRTVRQPTYLTN